MIPNIFVSSTIEDLHHLRDAIRDAIKEFGYNPIMSDYGDIGYSPLLSAEQACYSTIKDCQVAILIVGKRYGCLSSNNLSITHNELRAAKGSSIPIITLVDREILSYKQVYDANKPDSKVRKFPGMDNHERTFELLTEINESSFNNAIIPFSKVSEARDQLKNQLAHLFGDLLRGQFSPLKAEVKDILSEIQTLRHELLKKMGHEPIRFQKALRFLLSDHNADFKNLIESLCGELNSGIPVLINSKTFIEFLKTSGVKVTIEKEEIKRFEETNKWGDSKMRAMQIVGRTVSPEQIEKALIGFWIVRKDNQLIINPPGLDHFSRKHHQLLKSLNPS